MTIQDGDKLRELEQELTTACSNKEWIKYWALCPPKHEVKQRINTDKNKAYLGVTKPY
jgi:hypothetical protein